jgi:hypothetical protein
MGIQVNVENGEITPVGSTLAANTPFEWVNNTSNPVQLTNCGTWCDKNTYDVAPNGGTAAAQSCPSPISSRVLSPTPAGTRLACRTSLSTPGPLT